MRVPRDLGCPKFPGKVKIGFQPLTEHTNFLTNDPVNPPFCALPPVNVHDYPKVAVLKDGRLMHMDGEVRVESPPQGNYHVSYFLDPESPSICTSEVSNPRWTIGVTDLTTDPHLPPSEPIEPVMFGGGGVYLITREFEDNTSPTTVDVAYMMGGTVHGNDDKPCPDTGVPITDVTKKMLAPSETAAWDQTGVPSMNRQRLNGVATVLLDGSILVTGGTSKDNPMGGEDSCTFAMRPERFKPPEIFHDVSLVPAENPWRLMAKAGHRRTYHNTAGLLPDGRVYVAGSQYGSVLQLPPAEHDSRYSVEIFSPPYMFVGPRPEILNPPETTVFMGDVAEIEVRLGSADRRIERIAMLRNSSTTHAFDMNQRYVEVKVTGEPEQDSEDPLLWTVPIIWPGTDVDDDEKPQDIMVPGWHLLTVVDAPHDPDAQWDCGSAEPGSVQCTQRPSEAVWVQLFPQLNQGQ